jgi:LysR family glycine cleavage system transcriptional activator
MKLPPLNALRAFEAAARYGSFTRAAEGLNVTQAAVSQQVRHLEEYLGSPLFERKSRGIELTDLGKRYAGHVSDALREIARATEAASIQRDLPLVITTMPSFASTWLLARLASLHRLHPEIVVRLEMTQTLVDLEGSDVDAAIRYGRGHWPGLRSELLLQDSVFPVCTPEMAGKLDPDDVLESITRVSLLYDFEENEDWSMWLAAAGHPGQHPKLGSSFADSAVLVRAALQGQGLSLARSELTAEDLKSGRLVRPFEAELPCIYSYYLVYPEATATNPAFQLFRAWLFEEAAAA